MTPLGRDRQGDRENRNYAEIISRLPLLHVGNNLIVFCDTVCAIRSIFLIIIIAYTGKV